MQIKFSVIFGSTDIILYLRFVILIKSTSKSVKKFLKLLKYKNVICGLILKI